MSLHIGNNCIVRSISTNHALHLLQRWSLELQIHSDTTPQFDSFITDNESKNIEELANWIIFNHTDVRKGIFVSYIDEIETMIAFIENRRTHIQVNGFLSCPMIDNDTHLIARSSLALELLDMASSNDENIVFIFAE